MFGFGYSRFWIDGLRGMSVSGSVRVVKFLVHHDVTQNPSSHPFLVHLRLK